MRRLSSHPVQALWISFLRAEKKIPLKKKLEEKDSQYSPGRLVKRIFKLRWKEGKLVLWKHKEGERKEGHTSRPVGGIEV